MAKKSIVLIISAFLAFTIDRLTKIYFILNPDASFVVAKKILLFELHINAGMVFGFFVNNLVYYILFALITLILFYLLVDCYRKQEWLLLWCLAFIVIGAFSNLLDRLNYGGVVDFINVPFWSIFNLADIYIMAAVFIWLISLIKNGKIHKKS